MAERIVTGCPAGHIDTPFVVEVWVPPSYTPGLIFECPVCQARWPRFSEGRLHRAALKAIEEWGGRPLTMSRCSAVLDSYDSQHRCSGAANHDGPHRCEVCLTTWTKP